MTHPHDPQGDSAQDPYYELRQYLPQQDDGAFERFMSVSDEADNSPLYSRRKQLIAAATSLAVIAGIGMATEFLGNPGKPRHAAVAHAHEAPAMTAPSTTGNGRIDADIRKAVALGGCETEVEYNDVVGVYNRIFGGENLSNASIPVLQSATNISVESLKSARSRLDFIPTPKEFNELETDAYGLQKIPLARYQSMLQDYLSQFGVRALYKWNPQDKPEFKYFIAPVPAENLASSHETRLDIVSILNNFRSLPKSIVEESGLKTIVFGNILQNFTLGEVPLGKRTILFDVSDFNKPDNSLWGNLSLIGATPDHEIMHRLDDSMCFALTKGYGSDKGYISFNHGFIYGKKAQDVLETKGKQGHFTTLDANEPGSAVVARAYGAFNQSEDKATLIGENILYTDGVTNLFANEKPDKTILDEKIALELARVEKHNSDATEFYIQVLRAARLDTYIFDRMTKLSLQFGIRPTQEQQAVIQRETEPYSLMTRAIWNAIRGDYCPSTGIGKGGAAD